MTMSLKKRFKVGQVVYALADGLAGYRQRPPLMEVTLTKVGVKYLAGDAWWAKRLNPSRVYLSRDEYDEEQLHRKANEELLGKFQRSYTTKPPGPFTLDQIREACKILELELDCLREPSAPTA